LLHQIVNNFADSPVCQVDVWNGFIVVPA